MTYTLCIQIRILRRLLVISSRIKATYIRISHQNPRFIFADVFCHFIPFKKSYSSLFQPSILGHDQCGISETIEFVLKKYPEEVQVRDLQLIGLAVRCSTMGRPVSYGTYCAIVRKSYVFQNRCHAGIEKVIKIFCNIKGLTKVPIYI